MRKIKVLRIINRFNIGGPTYNATFLTRFLGDEFETMLIGGLPEEGEANSLHIPEQYGVNVVLLKEMQRKPSVKSDYAAYKRIKNIIQEFKPDIVHTHAAKAGALGRLAAKSCGVPVILHTYHGHVFKGYFSPLKTSIYLGIERFLANRSNKIIAISPLQKKELIEDFSVTKADKMEVVQLGFDLNRFHNNALSDRLITRKKYQVQDDEVAVAIIGRLTAIKNHAFFIRCLKNVAKDTVKKVRVFIVGDGEEREAIEQQINSIKWPSNIRIELTSWIKDIAAFNPGMDLICLCSKNEGTPVSLIEAQAANVPVLTTDVGGVRDIVANKKTGIIVTYNDEVEYTNALLELIEDDQLRKGLSLNGWNHVKDNFHYERLVNDMKKLYLKLLRENNVN